MMSESYSNYNKVLKYYGNGTHEGVHFPFNFWFITDLNKDSNARDIKFIIDKWLTYMPLKNTANWVVLTRKVLVSKNVDIFMINISRWEITINLEWPVVTGLRV